MIQDRTSPITIKSVEAIPVALPLVKPMWMAGVEIRCAENLLVRIEASNGTVGWGEAASAPTMTGDTLPAMVAAVRLLLAPMLLGEDARARARLVRRMSSAVHANTGARSAVEIALADVVGRSLGVSFGDLFGGAMRRTVAPMWLIGNAKVEDDISEAESRMREGYAFFKLKVGVKPVEEEIEATIRLRQALGDEVTLCADANCGFDEARAGRYLAGVAGTRLKFLEQPLPPENLAGLARLARRQSIPIGADEGIHGARDIEMFAEAGGCGLSLKLIKLGGPAQLLTAAAIAEQRGLAVNLAGKVAESGIGSAATLHMASLVPSLEWGLSLTHVYLEEDIVKPMQSLEKGEVRVPDGPGLGVVIDETKIERVRVVGV